MKRIGILAIGGVAWAMTGTPAAAQAAAETAVLTGTTGSATAKGSRSVGSAMGGAMSRAGNRIRSRGNSRNTRSRRGGNAEGATIGTGDVLEGSDAETHAMDNGASVRVSGGLRPRAARNETSEAPSE
ncbi:hypothetical protein [Altererythrobacter sp. MF3-039]|uniref:hypothetical protein n=1 Tax=Altererythrobacter sp. MF3-039 TaxID=3252901 RepID=UPI00390CC2EA